MKPPLRIAILECDTPLDSVREKYGGYGAIFKNLLERGIDAIGQPDVITSKRGLDVTYYDVVTKQEYPKLETIDAVLLTGSSEHLVDF